MCPSEILPTDTQVAAFSPQQGCSGGEKADCKMPGVNLLHPVRRQERKRPWSRNRAQDLWSGHICHAMKHGAETVVLETVVPALALQNSCTSRWLYLKWYFAERNNHSCAPCGYQTSIPRCAALYQLQYTCSTEEAPRSLMCCCVLWYSHVCTQMRDRYSSQNRHGKSLEGITQTTGKLCCGLPENKHLPISSPEAPRSAV